MVLNQQQFFDTGPYTHEAPATQDTSAFDNASNYMRTGKTGVSGLADRQARKLVNSRRVEQYESRYSDSRELAPEDYGVPRHPSGFWAHTGTWLPGTHAEHEWRKFGRVEEVPYTEVMAGQNKMSPRRVAEAAVLPGSTTDPRFTGGLRELPHAVKAPTSLGDTYVLHQGHHRFIGDRMKQQPEMFSQMRVVDYPKTPEERDAATSELGRYRMQRVGREIAANQAVADREVPLIRRRKTMVQQARRMDANRTPTT